MNETPSKMDERSATQPSIRPKMSSNSDSNYSSDRTKSSDEEESTMVDGKNSNFASRKQTPEQSQKKEDNEIPLGADADTLNQSESAVADYKDDDNERRNNIDETSAFRAKPPSTAMSTCSTISTGQLIPSSGKIKF